MADQALPPTAPGQSTSGYSTDFGNNPEVSASTLESTNRVVSSVDQAIAVCQALEWDANLLIRNAAKITSLKQGAKPYSPKRLEQQMKAWKTNISTGAFSTTLARVAPRLYMPLKQASTLTAAELPAGWPDGARKSQLFREAITEGIRSWPRWNWFITGLAKEVVDYGFTFAAFTDPFEWRPHMVRMDRGFVPRGSEIMDLDLPFFEMKWDYKPEELLGIARPAIEAGVTGWEKEAVAQACQWAKLPAAANTPPTEWRKWEELIREQVWNTTYKKGYKIIETKHLFVTETNGMVSHYLLWPDGDDGNQLLFKREDAYESMSDVVVPIVFGWGDGTIHGSWGAGHLLYDLGRMVEKIRCDMIDNLRNANKSRLQVNDPKDINDVKQVVNDTEIILSGAQFANNLGGVTQNVEAYITLNNFITQFMDTKVGAYIPPIPAQANDIKAAQINQAQAQEQEINLDSIETNLAQVAHVIAAMTSRLCRKGNPDMVAQAVQARILKDLTEQEISILVNQPVVRSVMEFTPAAAQAKGVFARAVMGNPLFYQSKLARLVAEGVPGGGSRLADEVVIPDGDQQATTEALRQQTLENTTLATSQDVPVLASDNHAVHINTMKEPLTRAIQGGAIQSAAVGLKHLTAHWTAGVAQKTLPDQMINDTKSFIAKAQAAIQQMQLAQQQQQLAQQQQQAVTGAGQPPPGLQPQLQGMQ